MKTKKIIYFVGAYGSGKTTATIKSQALYNASASIIEDASILNVIKRLSPDYLLELEHFILMTYYQRLAEKIDEDHRYIFVDGHPLLPMMYLRTDFEVFSGYAVSLAHLLRFGKMRFSMWKQTQDLFKDYKQYIIYINLPMEEHVKIVEDRFSQREIDFPMENDIERLKAVRRVIHSEIHHIGEELYGCEVHEVDSMKKINELVRRIVFEYPLTGG